MSRKHRKRKYRCSQKVPYEDLVETLLANHKDHLSLKAGCVLLEMREKNQLRYLARRKVSNKALNDVLRILLAKLTAKESAQKIEIDSCDSKRENFDEQLLSASKNILALMEQAQFLSIYKELGFSDSEEVQKHLQKTKSFFSITKSILEDRYRIYEHFDKYPHRLTKIERTHYKKIAGTAKARLSSRKEMQSFYIWAAGVMNKKFRFRAPQFLVDLSKTQVFLDYFKQSLPGPESFKKLLVRKSDKPRKSGIYKKANPAIKRPI